MRTRPSRPAAFVLAPLILAAPLVAIAAPASAADADIRINEVESNGDTNDWIELVNTGAEPVVLDGWVVKDDDDAATDSIPAGTTLAPGEFYVIEEPVIEFGLGGADVARIFLPDGTTLIDSFAWDEHAATTYGRNPDGTGDFVTTVASTKGAANSFVVDPADALLINEIESQGGEPGDWVELVNTSAFDVDASGLVISDSDPTHAYALPAGTTIAAGEYLVLDGAVLDFGLGGGDSARLLEADGTTVIDEYTWAEHAPTTYGRCPDTVGGFQATLEPTKGAVNSCAPPTGADILVNEVESSGGTPGDWAEFYNPGTAEIDLSGWIVRDNDPTEALVLPAGTVIAAGGFLAVDTEAEFGLGANDAVGIYLPDGVTLVDEYSWEGLGHAPTTCGLNPATGEFATTSVPTKGAANSFGPPVLINEIESDGGTPSDWVELGNFGDSAVDASGLVIRDSDDTHSFVLPADTTIESGGYLAVDVDPEFGLGDADSVRLFDADGTTLLDSYTWAEHAAMTWGRCPDLTGEFAVTLEPTKGLINACEGEPQPNPATTWPGSPNVAPVDLADTFGEDLSGLAYETDAEGDILWAVENGNGLLYRLVFDGTNWVPDADKWTDGAKLRYPDGTGTVDAEGVGFTDAGSDAGVYVASERNNDDDEVNRRSVLRYDVTDAAAELTATQEWNLDSDLPGLDPNGGLEGIAFIPDADLLTAGFVDESTGAAYDPADYPGHGDGLFFVGVEEDGNVYGYALNDDGSFARVATIVSGFDIVAELEYDTANGTLLVVCDQECDGQITRFDIGDTGAFEPIVTYARPAGMPNLANEGFALAPQCVDGSRAAYWADDGDNEGFAIRAGSIDCTTLEVPGPGTDPGTTPGDGSEPDADDDELAATGTDAASPLILAFALFAAGMVLVAARRRVAARATTRR